MHWVGRLASTLILDRRSGVYSRHRGSDASLQAPGPREE